MDAQVSRGLQRERQHAWTSGAEKIKPEWRTLSGWVAAVTPAAAGT
ncbi:hypothetical protein AA13594_1578 [Gluconacetobacter azotocaptans DSM 13594]|nr:hypothetical protein AA13594_1578 [Gluconacetobacter azotocaptans DSM 13594]